MIFKNRTDAGRRLAKKLLSFAEQKDILVLGIPRGGVTVAFEIASALHAPLDIFLSRKLGVPGHEELAFGAVASGGGRYLDQRVVQAAHVTPQQIEYATARVLDVLAQRASLYRGDHPALPVRGRTVILVDDGIATGASVYAAISPLRQMQPTRLILAAPVAPYSTCAWLEKHVDQLVCLDMPRDFQAVGQFYEEFSQVTDDEVIHLLQRSRTPNKASAKAASADDSQGMLPLEGMLEVPENASGLHASRSLAKIHRPTDTRQA